MKLRKAIFGVGVVAVLAGLFVLNFTRTNTNSTNNNGTQHNKVRKNYEVKCTS